MEHTKITIEKDGRENLTLFLEESRLRHVCRILSLPHFLVVEIRKNQDGAFVIWITPPEKLDFIEIVVPQTWSGQIGGAVWVHGVQHFLPEEPLARIRGWVNEYTKADKRYQEEFSHEIN